MDVHLVAVKVGVVGRGVGQRQAKGHLRADDRLHRLERVARQRGVAVDDHVVAVLDPAVVDVPEFRHDPVAHGVRHHDPLLSGLAVDAWNSPCTECCLHLVLVERGDALGPRDGLGDVLGHTHLPELEARVRADDRATRKVDTLGHQTGAGDGILALDALAHRLVGAEHQLHQGVVDVLAPLLKLGLWLALCLGAGQRQVRLEHGLVGRGELVRPDLAVLLRCRAGARRRHGHHLHHHVLWVGALSEPQDFHVLVRERGEDLEDGACAHSVVGEDHLPHLVLVDHLVGLFRLFDLERHRRCGTQAAFVGAQAVWPRDRQERFDHRLGVGGCPCALLKIQGAQAVEHLVHGQELVQGGGVDERLVEHRVPIVPKAAFIRLLARGAHAVVALADAHLGI